MMDRHETLLDLFLHPGWQLITQEAREAHEYLIESAWLAKTEAELYKIKGEIEQLSKFLAIEDMTKMTAEEEIDGPLYE